jgi:hypothetical protein
MSIVSSRKESTKCHDDWQGQDDGWWHHQPFKCYIFLNTGHTTQISAQHGTDEPWKTIVLIT